MKGDVDQLVTQVKGGGPLALRAAARLMSIMTDEPQRLAELLVGSRDWPQPRLILGITGAPGSGKSTLTDHLAIEYRNLYPDCRLGIVAVDPSSPFTGGALLGDRVRMMRHSTDPNVFIRSIASRGHLGGLALGTKGVVRVMGLIGCDVVIVETVGVGQSEVEIAKNSDFVIVVLAPGQGDSVQMLKAGLMEAGDMFVVNKCDRDDAAVLHQQLLSSLLTARMARMDAAGSAHTACAVYESQLRDNVELTEPPVFLCSAANHDGIGPLIQELERITACDTQRWRRDRERQALDEIRQAVLEEVGHRICNVIGSNGTAHGRTRSILDGTSTLNKLVDDLLQEAVARTSGKLE